MTSQERAVQSATSATATGGEADQRPEETARPLVQPIQVKISYILLVEDMKLKLYTSCNRTVARRVAPIRPAMLQPVAFVRKSWVNTPVEMRVSK